MRVFCGFTNDEQPGPQDVLKMVTTLRAKSHFRRMESG
jgi:hypothetical protein